MARQRVTTSDLTRLLRKAPGPIYVLDRERTIVFCNRALAEWTATDAGDLVGRRVDYAIGSDGAEPPGVAAGLCPPAETFEGRETQAVVTCMSAQGRLVYRRARFIPLGEGQACVAWLVLVDQTDMPAAEAFESVTPPATPAAHHLEIQRFRAQQQSRYGWPHLIGNSPQIGRAREAAMLAAQCAVSTLVVGSPGSGREHIAKSIHYNSLGELGSRLIPVRCDLADPDVLGSTVAGALRSSHDHQQATLLLLEVDRLSEAGQLCLGEKLPRGVPLRLLATAETRLVVKAERGEFRADLAARLSTLEIELPPLVGRLEDLGLLCQLFIEEANAEYSGQVAGLTPAAFDVLASYAWPRNLDELRETIYSAYQATSGTELEVAALPLRVRQAAQAMAYPNVDDEAIVLEEFLAEIESELVKRALRRAGGNKTRAAQLLGISRPRFYRRLVQLGLEQGPVEAEDVE